MSIGNTPSSNFWKNFVARHWQQKPFLFKESSFVSLATETEVFQGVMEASRRFCDEKIKLPFQFFNEEGFSFEGKQLETYLPDVCDANLDGYAARVTQKLGGQKFALILNGLFFAHQPALWLRARSLLHGFLQLVPNQFWCSVLFAGNYDRTPFGVHQDDKSTFQFIIAGRKRMRLWSGEFVERHPEIRWTHNYERFLGDAITLDAEAGDVMFWDKSYWHIGESAEGLSIGLSIGLQDIKKSNAETEIERNLDKLIQRTSTCTNDFPPPAAWQELMDEDVIHADKRFPIEWLFVEKFYAVVSANGHTFPSFADSRIVRLLELLNTGVALRVEDLLTEFSGTTHYGDVEFEIKPEGLRDLLERLLSLRAIEKYQTNDSDHRQLLINQELLQNQQIIIAG